MRTEGWILHSSSVKITFIGKNTLNAENDKISTVYCGRTEDNRLGNGQIVLAVSCTCSHLPKRMCLLPVRAVGDTPDCIEKTSFTSRDSRAARDFAFDFEQSVLENRTISQRAENLLNATRR